MGLGSEFQRTHTGGKTKLVIAKKAQHNAVYDRDPSTK